jgi:hypothetical protein
MELDTIREIERLRVLADWYRDWALVSGSAAGRTARIGLADDIDAQARALMHRLRPREQPTDAPTPI